MAERTQRAANRKNTFNNFINLTTHALQILTTQPNKETRCKYNSLFGCVVSICSTCCQTDEDVFLICRCFFYLHVFSEVPAHWALSATVGYWYIIPPDLYNSLLLKTQWICSFSLCSQYFIIYLLKCPYYGLWKVHILVLVPNNRSTCMQGQKTLSLSYNMQSQTTNLAISINFLQMYRNCAYLFR